MLKKVRFGMRKGQSRFWRFVMFTVICSLLLFGGAPVVMGASMGSITIDQGLEKDGKTTVLEKGITTFYPETGPLIVNIDSMFLDIAADNAELIVTNAAGEQIVYDRGKKYFLSSSHAVRGLEKQPAGTYRVRLVWGSYDLGTDGYKDFALKKGRAPNDPNKGGATPDPKSPVDLSKSTVKVKIADRQWTGKDITGGLKITATVGDKSYTLTASDYTLSKADKYYRNIGKAKILVKAKGDSYTGSKTVVFKIVPKKTGIITAAAGKKLVKATWKKASAGQQITGYQLQYRQKGTAKWSKVISVSAKSTAYTVKNLKKDKAYQVRVRAYKKVSGVNYNGIWSAVKTSKSVK